VPTKGSIYTLTDPRVGTIRYVGKTTKPVAERLAGHLTSPTNPAMHLWISTLRSQGLIPAITQVAAVSNERLSSEEERLIKKHARDGHRLFNAPYYRVHMDDLTVSAPAAAQHTEPAPEAPAVSPRERRRKDFEVVVKARALGIMSRKMAALIVFNAIVAFAVQMLWRWRAVRYATAAVACGLYLGMAGFGPLVQDQILHRLPTAEISSFWHEYLTHPLLVMALHAVGALILSSVAGYFEARKEARAWLREREALKANVRKPTPGLEDDPISVALVAALALDAAAPNGQRS
jgi:hypothetical protein